MVSHCLLPNVGNSRVTYCLLRATLQETVFHSGFTEGVGLTCEDENQITKFTEDKNQRESDLNQEETEPCCSTSETQNDGNYLEETARGGAIPKTKQQVEHLHFLYSI